jgi:regulator of sirC expression with transglutaminase-like and TPR domain
MSPARTIFAFLLLAASAAAADEPSPSSVRPAAEQLVLMLDSNHFAERERAQRELFELGIQALPALEQVADSPSAEVRWRSRRISLGIQDRLLVAEFQALASAPKSKFDLERGMTLVARIENPMVEHAAILKKLDALSDRVTDYLGGEQKLSELPAREAVETLTFVLFIEERFAGNPANYDEPSNSSIDSLLTTHKGLPITLSHLMIAVGRRQGLPLEGLAIPGRYMVKYQPKPGHAEDEMVIDPWSGGAIYNYDQLEDIVASLGAGFDPDKHTIPADPRESLARMLRNLADDYRNVGRLQQALRTEKYLKIVTGNRE